MCPVRIVAVREEYDLRLRLAEKGTNRVGVLACEREVSAILGETEKAQSIRRYTEILATGALFLFTNESLCIWSRIGDELILDTGRPRRQYRDGDLSGREMKPAERDGDDVEVIGVRRNHCDASHGREQRIGHQPRWRSGEKRVGILL